MLNEEQLSRLERYLEKPRAPYQPKENNYPHSNSHGEACCIITASQLRSLISANRELNRIKEAPSD